MRPSLKCEQCEFYVPTKMSQAKGQEAEHVEGECREASPQVTHIMVQVQSMVARGPTIQPMGFAGWPIVKADQWCGRFRFATMSSPLKLS
jgi:hypothetical protein